MKKHSQTAWLFDNDGVLTYPELKKIRYEEILDELIGRLQKGEPIGINTGRSLVHIKKQFLSPLIHRLDELKISRELLHNVFITGEKGEVWLIHNDKGEPKEYIEKTITTPEFLALQSETKQLVKKQFSDVLFFDETKQTMITLEMNDGTTLPEFRPRQKELVPILHSLVAAHGLEQKLRIDATTIAIDIEDQQSGKALGAKRFLTWLTERKIHSDAIITFGDSASDYTMAEEIHKQEIPVIFVFVGKTPPSHHDKFPLFHPQKLHDEGTLQYLQENR